MTACVIRGLELIIQVIFPILCSCKPVIVEDAKVTAETRAPSAVQKEKLFQIKVLASEDEDSGSGWSVL